MNKRIICLLLSVIMLLSCCLTACSKKDSDEAIKDAQEKASESTITLAMYLVSEKEVSDEQAAAVQEAVNKITKSKFKAQLVLHFLTEDEYYKTLDKNYADHAAALADPNSELNKANAKKDEAETVTEETVLNEYGIPELKYPTIQDFQVDIMYISGYDRVKSYINEGKLADLSEELLGSASSINAHVAPQYLNYMTDLCGSNYAIPTNKPIGEYTYLLLNKELLNKYNYKASDFTTLTAQSTQNFLKRISESSAEYVPLRSFTGEIDVANTQYFGVDENGRFSSTDFSIFGGTYNPNWKYLQENQFTPFASVLDEGSDFRKQLTTIVNYKNDGYYGTDADAKKQFGVGYIKGGPEVAEKYGDDYELVVVENPVLSTYDIFSDMLAISANTVSVSRSMEILTYLYTNEDFRNLLLYGIEDVNYELRDSDVKDSEGKTIQYVHRFNEDYMMAPEKTGNVLLAYPLEGQPLNCSEFYKQQNADAKISCTLGFTHDYQEDMMLNPVAAQKTREVSEDALALLLAAKTPTQLDSAIRTIALWAADANVVEFKAESENLEEDLATEIIDPKNISFANMYKNWLLQTGLLVIEKE